MAELESDLSVHPPAAPALTKQIVKKVVKAKQTGPSPTKLILTALASSQQRGGVSVTAIKKTLLASGYDSIKNKKRVRLCLKRLVQKGSIIQTKGRGASGSFKINKKSVVESKKAPIGKGRKRGAKPKASKKQKRLGKKIKLTHKRKISKPKAKKPKAGKPKKPPAQKSKKTGKVSRAKKDIEDPGGRGSPKMKRTMTDI
ncbi:histone H1-like [Ascaphus truei]|uniref:histone H1-like n=1 Tax=Ascaphus truei TaxID=8439 RepID=UPI003F595304